MNGITWSNMFLGIWLVFSPFILGTAATAALWEDIIIGLLIAGFAFLQMLESDKEAASGYSYAMAVFGVWALFAPFLFGYANIAVALWNDVIVGTAVALLAFCQGMIGTQKLPYEPHHKAH